MDWNILFVILIFFFSTFIRATFGFGDAIIGMPLLALTIGLTTATPLMALTALTIALSILYKNWHHVDFHSTWRLIITSLIGIPIGIFFLKGFNEDLVKAILAFFVISFSLYKIISPSFKKLAGEKYAYIIGLIAGILGGAYNTNGPPIIFYATLKQWPPVSFRATLQGYFFSTGIFMVIGHFLARHYTPLVFKYYLIVMPVMILAIYLGGKLNQKISAEHFLKYVYWLLFSIGVMLLLSSLHIKFW